jgi:hypothetical protein
MQGREPLRLTIDKRHGRGSAPIARVKGFPAVFRASLVQTSAALRPFRSAFGSLSKGGRYPSP